MIHCRKQYTCTVIYKYKTLLVSNALSVQRFGTLWILKALHTASSCPISSAGVCFHHTVTASYPAHSAGSFSEAQQAYSDHTIILQLPGKKASQSLLRALSSFKQSERHKGAQEICPSCQAAPEPAPAATPQTQGMSHRRENHWGQRGNRPSSLITIHTWPLKATWD